MFAVATTLLVFLFTLLFAYNWQRQRYWKSKNVSTPPFWPFVGNLMDLISGCPWENIDKIYKSKKSMSYCGIYGGFSPELILCDPSRVKDVMVKNADHFTDRRTMKYSDNDAIYSEMLITVNGEKWKNLRSLMSPTFTSGKIKLMFPLISSKAQELLEECRNQMKDKTFLDMNLLFKYYTMDVIGTCAFGIDAHCLKNKEASQFIKSGLQLSKMDITLIMKYLILSLSPRLYKILGLQIVNEHLQFFVKVVEETVAKRKEAKNKKGDFLDILLEALEELKSEENKSKYPMTMSTVIAESVMFLLAGFETTSISLSFLIYLLAKNKEKQSILRKELQKIIQTDGELTYQNITEAQYLDACLTESLRLFAPAYLTERQCSKTYKFEETGLEIPEGMVVGIPIWSFHHDSEYWKDPYEFIPERFLPENRGEIIPYTYLPFGLGPRNCIGMRFAQLEVKIVIAKLILNSEINLRPGFTEVKFAKTPGTIRPDENGIQVVMNELSNN